MAKKPISAFFFDIDDTVYSITDFAHLARTAAVKAMIAAGLRISPEDCYQQLMEVIHEFGSNHTNHFDKLLKRLPEEMSAGYHQLLIKAAGVVAYHDTKPHHFFPFGDAISALQKLKAQNLPLGIITAGIENKQAEKIYRLGLHQIVEHRYIFITDSIGISKHNPELYHLACRTVGAVPERCIYIGDNPLVDVDVPASIGMITFLCRRGGKYRETTGKIPPRHTVDNFYDVLEIIENEYEIIAN